MLLVFGSINVDLFFPVRRIPVPGETELTRAARVEPGGKGANQAVAAALDGAQVAMAGAVGEDPLAELAVSRLIETGIDIARVKRAPETTGCAAVVVDGQGQNQIVVSGGANLLARASQVEDSLLGPQTTLLLQMECDPVEVAALIHRARPRGTRILLNFAPAIGIERAALSMVDLVIVNEPEAGWLGEKLGTSAVAPSLHGALGVPVIRTRGVQGAELGDAAGHFEIPVYPVDAADMTGAGDCFAGVLAAAFDRDIAIRDAMPRAAAAAALCCTRSGAQLAMPTAPEIDGALRRGSRRGR